MKNPQSKLDRLLALARRATTPAASESRSVPFGFSGRVAARWAQAGGGDGPGDFLERWCWWGASVSVAACLLTLALRPADPQPRLFEYLLQVPERPTALFDL